MEKRDWSDTILYWLVCCAGILAAGYHSYVVFALSDPPLVAFLGSVALEGVTFYAMHAIKNWFGNQRLAGFVGIALFGVVSFIAQQIARHYGMGEELPRWLAFVSLFIVPLSSVGSVVVLGIIRSFKDSKQTVSPYEDASATLKEVASGIKSLLTVTSRPPLALGDRSELDDFTEAELPKLTTEFAAVVPQLEVAKKRRGRPPKAIGV